MGPGTADTTAVYKTLRDRILGFSDGVTTVASLLGSGDAARLYQDEPPDAPPARPDGTQLYAHLRLVNERTDDDGYQERTLADLEVMIYGRPRTTRRDVRTLGDLVMGALKQFLDTTDGLLWLREGAGRDPIPPGEDRELIVHRLVAPVLLWPTYRTKIPT